MPFQPKLGKCDICERDNVNVSKYSFGESKQIRLFEPPYLKDNPNFLEIMICGSDLNIVVAMRKQNRSMSTTELFKKAKEYRAVNPIQPKVGKVRKSMPKQYNIVTMKCKDCSSTDTRMIKQIGSDKVSFVCKLHDPENASNIGTSFENMFDK